jgi:hypothetical protein
LARLPVRRRGARAGLGAAALGLFLFLGGSLSWGYIEALYPLGLFITESEVIAEGVVEKTDVEKKLCIVKVGKSYKGKCGYEKIRMNLSQGQDWHSEVIMRHLVEGSPVVIFYNPERRAEIYVNRFFCQLFGDPQQPPDQAWWVFTHTEIYCNRTYCGPVDELVRVLKACMAGKQKPPPPNPKLPAITRTDLKALPPPGQPQDAGSIPASFVAASSAKPRPAETPEKTVPGLAYSYFEGNWSSIPDFETLTPAKSGTSESIGLEGASRMEHFGLRFSGWIEVPKDGVYTFTLGSSGAGSIRIGKTEIARKGSPEGAEAQGEINLKAGKHAFQVIFAHAAGSPKLEVFWESSERPRQKIEAGALYHSP